MKNVISNLLTKTAKMIVPLVLVLAVSTANTTCLFFTYQPEEPEGMKKYHKYCYHAAKE